MSPQSRTPGHGQPGAQTFAGLEGLSEKGNSPPTVSLQPRLGPTYYIYTDEQGESLFRVVRQAGKQFRQQKYDAISERWLSTLGTCRRVLYRLPEVIEAVREGRSLFIVEGEKDVEALRSIGRVATCKPGGAGKWRDEYSKFFKGVDVAIVQDKDPAGHAHALQVYQSLGLLPNKVRLLEAAVGKDAADHIAAGLKTKHFRPAQPYEKKHKPPKPPPDSPLVPSSEQGLKALLSRLPDAVVVRRGQWEARCPAHDDRVRSLCVARGKYHSVVLHCQAGCPPDEVIAACGLTWQEVM